MSEIEIPKTMRAFVLTGHGDIDKLVFHDDWKTPEPAANQVLVKVHACGLNNTDINTRSGWYSKTVSEATTGEGHEKIDDKDPTWGGKPLTFPRIQGGDVCGTVVALGADVPNQTLPSQTLLGKRCLIDTLLRDWDDPLNIHKYGYYASECDGGYADYTVVDYRQICPIECGLSDAELASFAISYSTAENMLSRAAVGENDIVLVTGASGGVGSALVQLAKRRGAKVVALASEAKHEMIKSLGADVTLPRSPADLKQALRNHIGRDTVSVVADIVGGDYFSQVIDALEWGGRFTCSGAIAGPIVPLDLRTLYLRDLTFYGNTFLPPETFPNLVGYIERGEIKPVLAETYPLEKLHDAQRSFVAKKHVGNIVVTL